MDRSSAKDISLLLVDEHAMFREGLSLALGREPGFKVVGQVGSCVEALAVLRQSRATVVLLDINPGGVRAVDFIADSRKFHCKARMLIVTAGTNGQEAVQLLQAGVAGILHKHHSIEDLCDVVRRIVSGGVYLEPLYHDAVYRSFDRTNSRSGPRPTERDKVVLRLVAQGLSNRQISERLKITESGVKSSLRQLFDKTGVRTRAQLVRIAIDQLGDEP